MCLDIHSNWPSNHYSNKAKPIWGNQADPLSEQFLSNCTQSKYVTSSVWTNNYFWLDLCTQEMSQMNLTRRRQRTRCQVLYEPIITFDSICLHRRWVRWIWLGGGRGLAVKFCVTDNYFWLDLFTRRWVRWIRLVGGGRGLAVKAGWARAAKRL